MKLNCLRGFPHVIQRIKALWGHPELEFYIQELMISDRSDRGGFPPDAFKELNAIMDVHRLLFAKCDKADCCSGLDRGPFRW